MTASADLLVKIKGDTSDAEGAFGRLGSGIGSVAKIAGAAAIGAGAAVAGLTAKGVAEFASFEKGMNEVFTLMPGISADAMGAMEGDVLSLSKKMGVLPEEVIPALYDSISAGVPADSVFEFLETATKTSIGGVTDLGTAVDGITSTVNAFGSENMSAAKASDLMFTAVKLGKTTMDELSASLFQVNPIAAGLGVGFEDVTASLAVLTSQGVPTSVAATQMKGALAELGKQGSVAYEAFSQFTEGKTFAQFVKEGGSVEEALQLMSKGAKDAGVPITDFFGSIEAGQAAMALTSETGAAAFKKAMDEMANSSGATDEAFATMDQGLSRSMDKIKANVSAAFIQIGSVVAPFVEKAVDWFMSVLPGALAWFEDALTKIGPILADIGRWLGEVLPVAIDVAKTAFEVIAPIVSAVFETIQKAISTVVGWFSGNDGAGKISSTSSGIAKTFQTLWDDIKPIWDGVVETVTVAIELVRKVVELVLDGIRAFWENHGESVLSYLAALWEAIRAVISGALDVIKGVMDVVMGILSGDWRRVWDGIKGIVSGVWDAIVSVVQLALQGVGLAVKLALDGLSNLMGLIWNGIKTAATSAWNGLRDGIVGVVTGLWGRIVGTLQTVRSNLVSEFSGMVASAVQKVAEMPGKILGFLREIPGKILGAIGDVTSAAISLGKALIDGILNGFGNIASTLASKLKSGISSAVNSVKSFFGIASPSVVMEREIGLPLAQGIIGLPEEAIDFARKIGGQIEGIRPVPAASSTGAVSIVVEGNLFGASTVDELVSIFRDRLGVDAIAGGTVVA